MAELDNMPPDNEIQEGYDCLRAWLIPEILSYDLSPGLHTQSH